MCGVNDTRIQRRLLSEVNLDFDRALATAHAMEMADRDAEQLHDGVREKPAAVTEGAVHGNANKPNQNCYQNCYRCGGQHGPQRQSADTNRLCVTIVARRATLSEFAERKVGGSTRPDLHQTPTL